jgi:hypothetical protein
MHHGQTEVHSSRRYKSNQSHLICTEPRSFQAGRLLQKVVLLQHGQHKWVPAGNTTAIDLYSANRLAATATNKAGITKRGHMTYLHVEARTPKLQAVQQLNG